MTGSTGKANRTPSAHRSWTRLTVEGGWTEVVLERDTGSRVAGAVATAFPGAAVHAIVTDVLGPHEARIETPDGRRLAVQLDGALRVTGWRTVDVGRHSTVVSIAA